MKQYFISYNTSVSGNYAYIADSTNLKIFDIRTPGEPTHAATILKEKDLPWDIAVSGNIMCLVRYNDKLEIFDISEFRSPKLLSAFSEWNTSALCHTRF